MKAYRKFVFSACAPAKVANLAKVRTHEDETLATLATLAAGGGQTTNLGGKPNDGAPPDPDEAERAAIAIELGGVPLAYADAWARLQCQRPFGASDQEWRQVMDDAGKFFDTWGSRAVEFGWTAGDLFDVPRDGKPGGLVWFLGGESVQAIGPRRMVTQDGRVFNRFEN
jgi:hypothetical protein